MSVRAHSVRFPVAPRCIPVSKAARRLGITEASFREVEAQLYQADFPRPDCITGMFDIKAIDAWLDRRSGLTPPDAVVQPSGSIREKLDAWKNESPTQRRKGRAAQGASL